MLHALLIDRRLRVLGPCRRLRGADGRGRAHLANAPHGAIDCALAAAGHHAQAAVRRRTRALRASALLLPAGLSAVSDRVRRTRSGRSGLCGGETAGRGVSRRADRPGDQSRAARQQLQDQQSDQHAAARPPRCARHGRQRRLRRPRLSSQRHRTAVGSNVGLVTCLYRGVPTPKVWSRLGAMYINEWYHALGAAGLAVRS